MADGLYTRVNGSEKLNMYQDHTFEFVFKFLGALETAGPGQDRLILALLKNQVGSFHTTCSISHSSQTWRRELPGGRDDSK
jgi:hypothetical protein